MTTLTEGAPLEAELWLRRAAESRPDDSTAAVLLAGLNARLRELVHHSDDWIDPESSGHVEFRDRRRTSARARFRAQAGEWYGRTLAVDPTCAPAATGLVAMRRWTVRHSRSGIRCASPARPSTTATR